MQHTLSSRSSLVNDADGVREGMMVRRAITAVFACGAILASASPALAQGWTAGPMPRQGACFYQDINFRGQYFCVEAGENLDAMPSGANDRVSRSAERRVGRGRGAVPSLG